MKKKLREQLQKLRQEVIDLTEELEESLINSIDSIIEEKEPVFYIEDKPMYEGDTFYSIQKSDNWKLKERKTSNIKPVNLTIRELFATKESALNYILYEAKKRFEGCNEARVIDIDTLIEIDSTQIKIKHSSLNYGCKISDNTFNVWSDKLGWICEPVKEKRLMLGDEVVEIKDFYELGIRCIEVHCKGEVVLKEEWMTWYNYFMSLPPYYSLKTYLSKFEVSGENSQNIHIGCNDGIKNATIEQIEAITKVLNEL